MGSKYLTFSDEIIALRNDLVHTGINKGVVLSKNPTDKKNVIAIKQEYDKFFDDAVDNALFGSGDNPQAIEALKENDLETLGALMNINHALLYGIGVSDESLEWLINAARKAGALGAKLTGAGGGGCMIALATNEKIKQVFEAIQNSGGKPFMAKKTDEGVKIERT